MAKRAKILPIMSKPFVTYPKCFHLLKVQFQRYWKCVVKFSCRKQALKNSMPRMKPKVKKPLPILEMQRQAVYASWIQRLHDRVHWHFMLMALHSANQIMLKPPCRAVWNGLLNLALRWVNVILYVTAFSKCSSAMKKSMRNARI